MSKQYANLTGQPVAFDLAATNKSSARKTTSILSRRVLRTQRRQHRAL